MSAAERRKFARPTSTSTGYSATTLAKLSGKSPEVCKCAIDEGRVGYVELCFLNHAHICQFNAFASVFHCSHPFLLLLNKYYSNTKGPLTIDNVNGPV